MMINFDLFGFPILPESKKFGLPYMGSKRGIAKELMQKMLEVKPNTRYFYDLFGGGGAMSFYALQCGLTVFYNEKNCNLVNFIKFLIERIKSDQKGQFGFLPDDFYKFITRKEFDILKKENSIKGEFARICYSFGNNQKNYLFNPEIEKLKHLVHDVVVFQDRESLKKINEELKTNIIISQEKTIKKRASDFFKQLEQLQRLQQLERLQQLQQLEQLQRLQQLERLQRLQQLQQLHITNLDFMDVKINTPLAETIIYMDPPYRGTSKYIEKSINYNVIDDFFRNSKYSCFMSEYNAPFNPILKIKKTSLLNNSLENKKMVVEKLFYNNK